MSATIPAFQPERVEDSNDDVLDINFLPNEIILKIFSYLGQNQLGQIARVCRRWSALTKSPDLWIKVNVDFHESHGSQNSVAQFFIHTLPSRVTRMRLHFRFHSCWTEPLIFEELSAKLRERCPHLEVLILDCAKLSDSFSSVIEFCTHFLQDVKILIFRFSVFPDGPIRTGLDGISKIEVLDISCCHLGPYNKIPLSKMPYLKRLRLGGLDINDSKFEESSSFLSELNVLDVGYTMISNTKFRAVWNLALNLKELYLCGTDMVLDDLTFNNLVFPHLNTICINLCRFVNGEIVVALVQSCHSLQNVYVTQEVAQSLAVHAFAADNRSKSQIVKAIHEYIYCFKTHTVSYLHK